VIADAVGNNIFAADLQNLTSGVGEIGGSGETLHSTMAELGNPSAAQLVDISPDGLRGYLKVVGETVDTAKSALADHIFNLGLSLADVVI
jgi:hypothetical protein